MAKNHKPYLRLAVMAALSYVAMYVLMYAMVDTFDNVVNNLNQVYMAGLMAAPMVVIEILLMGAMYPNKKANILIGVIGILALAGCFGLIRKQAAIDDKQFLRSMIPHHAGAILMCNEASLQDPEIKALCQRITAGQRAEIEQMKAKLAQLEK